MELSFLHALQGLHNEFLDFLMVALSSIGNSGILWVLLALCFLFSRNDRKCGAVMIAALIIMLLFGNVFLKPLVARDRPCWVDKSVELLVAAPKDYSFPSGHTYSGFAAAFVLLHYHPRKGWVAVILASLIAFSRLYLFVHYPTDVLGGAVLGIWTAWLAYTIADRLWDKRESNLTSDRHGKEKNET